MASDRHFTKRSSSRPIVSLSQSTVNHREETDVILRALFFPSLPRSRVVVGGCLVFVSREGDTLVIQMLAGDGSEYFFSGRRGEELDEV